MKKYLLLLMLAFCPSAHAQAVPAKVHAVGACNPKMIESTLHLFTLQKAAPAFELFVFCQPTDWKEFLIHVKIRTDAAAFTDWTHGKIYLGPEHLDDAVVLRSTISHELNHLRCACLLGEKP